MNLTPHFTLEELIQSETAARQGLDNTPPPDIMPNLQRLAEALERLRELLGHAIHINSGYRSPTLNQVVGGSKNSQHVRGLAADLICPAFGPPFEVCRAIEASDLAYSQLIFEYDSWTHFAIAELNAAPRMETLTISTAGTIAGLHPVSAVRDV